MGASWDITVMADETENDLVYDWSYLKIGGGFSFVVTLCIFKLVGPAVSTKMTSSYSSLSGPAQSEWNDRIISNVNSVVSIALSGYCLFLDDEIKTDVVWYDSKIARMACSIIIGYMMADLVIMVLWCTVSVKELLGFMFHHIASVFAYFYVSAYGILCYFAMLRLIAEGSTPAMNQRWFFDVAGYKRGSALVVANGCLMLLTFFCFRVLVLPVFWYQIWQITGTASVTKLGHIQVTVMYLPSMVLDTLNIYWFYKMCKGFTKAVKGMLNTPTTSLKVAQEHHLKEG